MAIMYDYMPFDCGTVRVVAVRRVQQSGLGAAAEGLGGTGVLLLSCKLFCAERAVEGGAVLLGAPVLPCLTPTTCKAARGGPRCLVLLTVHGAYEARDQGRSPARDSRAATACGASWQQKHLTDRGACHHAAGQRVS